MFSKALDLRRTWPLAAAFVIYLALGLARVYTTHPWNDEAWYASPAFSLMNHGNTGTPLLEETHNFWKGINQWTYWVPPLHFYVQVPWFEIFGFGLISARAQAMFWGAIALLAWGGIVFKLTADRVVALWTLLFIACDYQFVSQVSLARMDAMAIAFAALGILLYLVFRERNLLLAVALSQASVVACGISHPNPGVPAFAAVAFLTLYYDRRRIRWRHALAGAVPYLIGAAGWGLYIGIAPEFFKAQFFGNVGDLDRLGGFKNPAGALLREFQRYAFMSGFEATLHPLYRVKLAIILIYAACVAALFLNRETRRDPRYRPLLLLWLVYFLTMAIYDNTKEIKYALQIVVLYDALLAVALTWWWRNAIRWRMAVAAVAAVFIAVSAGGLLYTSLRRDAYHGSYLPMTSFLKRHAGPKDMIFAGSEAGFALGFDRNIVDDRAYGYFSHKSPDFIVLGTDVRDRQTRARLAGSEILRHLDAMLERDFRRVYSNGGYDIFRRNAVGVGPAVSHPPAGPPGEHARDAVVPHGPDRQSRQSRQIPAGSGPPRRFGDHVVDEQADRAGDVER